MIRDLLVVAARAALQWALASLLLANGAAFCVIAAAAARLRLGPPCIFCARVHRLLCSNSASDHDALCRLLCDAHLAAAAGPAAPPDPGDAGAVAGRASDADAHGDKVSGLETHRVVSIGSEICEQDNERGHAAVKRGTDNATTGGGDDPFVSLFELAPIVARPRDHNVDDENAPDTDQAAAATSPEPDELLSAVNGDESEAVARLASALRAQRLELDALRAQLAAERRERAEAEEYQRQLEEQGELDREAARLAMQLVHEAETEKHGLQRQLEACRVRAQLRDGQGAAAGEEDGGGADGNNYQSLVDFLPGSVYSSSPDLANLLKLYTTEAGNGHRRQRDGYMAVVADEPEEQEEEKDVAVAVVAGSESVDSAAAIAGESLHERSTSCLVETVTETTLAQNAEPTGFW